MVWNGMWRPGEYQQRERLHVCLHASLTWHRMADIWAVLLTPLYLCTWLPTSKTIPPQPNIRISLTQIQPSSTTGTTNALQPNGNPCTKRHKTFRVIPKQRGGIDKVKPYEPKNMMIQYLIIQNNIYLLLIVTNAVLRKSKCRHKINTIGWKLSIHIFNNSLFSNCSSFQSV